MRKIATEVLVIGGGATGAGVVRDAAMRGFKAILVERSDLAVGTTGRYHGLLHSGGRYAVKDPEAARECIEENRILRRIMPFCIEDTGGFFVQTPWDDPSYAPRFLAGCQAAGIPVEDVPISQMLKEEPLLNPRISRCLRVPDGSADSWLGADANALSAREYGAQVLSYHEVRSLTLEEKRVTGALVYDRVHDEELLITADIVVNAAGAWCGKIAASAGVTVQIIPGKGTMLAMNQRILNTVANRLKMPSDGDIIVPAHTVAVVGTTDTPVPDPDHFGIEPWEVKLMLDEGDKMVPGLSEMRVLRAWAGVRPLFKETQNTGGNRDVTRAYVLLDHESRDGVSGLVTITSGKWTTYRRMAEVTVDLVCRKLNVQRTCRTADETLPDPAGHGPDHAHFLGTRLAKIEKEQLYGQLVCECELATRADVVRAIEQGGARTIDDIRRDARLGMGPCQGGFCTVRAAGLLHDLRSPAVESTNAALRDFLQERWKGLLPVLWGQQLRQERLDELIYLSVLNTGQLPGPRRTRLAAEPYAPPDWTAQRPGQPEVTESSDDTPAAHPASPDSESPAAASLHTDVLVVGAGPAGLAAAWQVSQSGKRVRLVSKGWGTFYWNAGTVDVLGYLPGQEAAVTSPRAALPALVERSPHHPYALLGAERVEEALSAFQELCAAAGYPLQGSLDENWLLPSAIGALRPTCLAPETMIAGDLRRTDPVLIVGIDSFPDIFPGLLAANLSAQGIPSMAISIRIPVMQERRFVTGRTLAWMFDQSQHRAEVARLVKAELAKVSLPAGALRVGFPAVLGLDHPLDALHDLQDQLGLPVFEIPSLPPSIPGIRLHKILQVAIERAGGRVYDGMQAVKATFLPQGLSTVWTEAAVRLKPHRAQAFILATGGILGGGVKAYYPGSLVDTALGLPVTGPDQRQDWFSPEFLSAQGQPVYRSGLRVDKSLQPRDGEGQLVAANVYAAGGALAGFDFIQERSLEGVALATGYWAGRLAVAQQPSEASSRKLMNA